MKKLTISFLSIFLILGLTSCGSKPAPEDTTEPTAPIEEQIEENIEGTVSTVDNSLAMASMNASRQEAIDCEAEKYAPAQFKTLEDKYAALKARADNGEDVSAECEDLALRYKALAAYVNALITKEKVEATDKYSLIQSIYDEGCKYLAEYEAAFDDPAATGSDLFGKATSAYTSFNTVYITVCKQLAKDARTAALDAKKNADSVKAGVSQKVKYNEAAELFKKGDSLYSMMNPAKAYDNYVEAEEIFTELFDDISEKRAAALAAIEAAKKSVEASAAIAEEADLEAPITGELDGIEDEDAVLLEEDDYEDPEDAEADLAEDIADPSLIDEIDNAANKILNALEDAK